MIKIANNSFSIMPKIVATKATVAENIVNINLAMMILILKNR